MSNEMPPLVAPSPPNPKVEKDLLLKRKEAWAESLNMSQVKFSEDHTSIESICGAPLKNFKGKMLIKFCRGNNIIVPNGQSTKAHCIQHIINHQKTASLRKKIGEVVRPPKNKATRPIVVTTEGTLYRVVLTITSEGLKETYMKTFGKKDRQQLDRGGLPFSEEWECLSKTYNDITREDLGSLGVNAANYAIFSVDEDEPSTFDELNAQEFASVVAYINYHYDKARKNKNVSGTHTSPFQDFAQQKGWLVFYNERLEEIGDRDLMAVAYAELPSDSFMVSNRDESKESKVNVSRRRAITNRYEANKSMIQKNNHFSLYAKDELRKNQEGRMEELNDSVFVLETQIREVVSKKKNLKRNRDTTDVPKEEMEELKQRKRYLVRKLARANANLDMLRKEMNYEEPDVEESESQSDSDE